MARYKKSKSHEDQSALAQRVFPHSVSDHADELEHEFAVINENIDQVPNFYYSIKWSKATRKLMKDGVKTAIDETLVGHTTATLSTKEGKEAFGNLILTKMGDKLENEIMPSVSKDDFDALHKSFQDPIHKIRTLHTRSLSNEVARLSSEYEPLGSSEDMERRTQVVQPGTRLQGSLDLSADENEEDGDEEIHGTVDVEIKKERDGEAGDLGDSISTGMKTYKGPTMEPPAVTQKSRDPPNEPTPSLVQPQATSKISSSAVINPTHKQGSSPDTKAAPTTTTTSALLETINAFRDFVMARENLLMPPSTTPPSTTPPSTTPPSTTPPSTTPPFTTQPSTTRPSTTRLSSMNMRKRAREEPEYLMSGALQTDDDEEKRAKTERDEAPVWPIGNESYHPPSIVEETRVGTTEDEG